MPCPHGVNIPACFAAYNASYSVGFYTGMHKYVTSANILIPKNNNGAANCEACGDCEKKCPQHIPIIKSLRKVARKMEPFWLKAAVVIVRKAMH